VTQNKWSWKGKGAKCVLYEYHRELSWTPHRKTDGCHYFKTLMVVFFFLLLMNESCLSPVNAPRGQRLRQDDHRSGCLFCRYLSPSMCPTKETSQQNHTMLASLLWHMRMYKYTKVHVPECIDFWGTCACWYHFVFTYSTQKFAEVSIVLQLYIRFIENSLFISTELDYWLIICLQQRRESHSGLEWHQGE